MKQPSIFLSCLGTTNYHELTYAPHDDEEAKATTTRFIQCARLEALAGKVDLTSAHVLVTAEARTQNWEDAAARKSSREPGIVETELLRGLARELRERGLVAQPEDIPNGAGRAEFWQIFSKVAELVPEGAELYVDLTHGFRTLPLLVLLALEYVEKAKGARIKELTYGADRVQDGGVAPTWNLEPFLVVRDWTLALSSFLEDGDTRPLARLAHRPIDKLTKELKQATPPTLRRLPKAFEAFGEALVKCHSPSIGEVAVQLRTAAAEAQFEVDRHPDLKPLGLILAKVQTALAHFPEDPASLRAQHAAARWCLDHGLVMQGLTFLREAYVTALSLLSAEARGKKRKEQDGLFGALKAGFSKEVLKGEDWITKQVQSWLEAPPLAADLWTELGLELSRLTEYRNELDHAYTSSGLKKPRSDQECQRDFLRLLNALIDHLEGLVPPPPVPHPKRMLVLFNRLLTDEQREDAHSVWGVQEVALAPECILEKWANLDPDADLPESLLAEARDWLREMAQPGDLVLVQGEPGLTWLVVHEARARQLVPVYSVTRREARDEWGSGGTVTKTSVFQHVRFREYPTC